MKKKWGNMNCQDEIWRDIDGYEGSYQVSNTGSVRSLDRFVKVKNHPNKTMYIKGKILIGYIDRGGYRKVTLAKNGINKHYFVHRLMAIEFIINPNGKPCINHKNGIKKDNYLKNLEWVTHSENLIHSRRVLGNKVPWIGEKHPKSKLKVEDVKEIKKRLKNNYWGLQSELSRQFSVDDKTIHGIKNNQYWKEVTI